MCVPLEYPREGSMPGVAPDYVDRIHPVIKAETLTGSATAQSPNTALSSHQLPFQGTLMIRS